jgi:hypothetical protein
MFSVATTMFKDIGGTVGPIAGGFALKSFGVSNTMLGVSVVCFIGAFALNLLFKNVDV